MLCGGPAGVGAEAGRFAGAAAAGFGVSLAMLVLNSAAAANQPTRLHKNHPPDFPVACEAELSRLLAA